MVVLNCVTLFVNPGCQVLFNGRTKIYFIGQVDVNSVFRPPVGRKIDLVHPAHDCGIFLIFHIS